MKKRILFSIGVAFMVLFINSAYAQYRINEKNEIIEKKESGLIDWSNSRISAKGCAENDQSLFNQKMAAEVTARANLLKVLDGVQIKSESIVRDGRTKGVISTEKVEGILKHSRVSEARKNNLGLLEVTAYVNVDKTARAILLPDTYFRKKADHMDMTTSALTLKSPLYSGIIIDARGLEVRPAMLPCLYDENGRIVFSPSSASKNSIMEYGFAGYTGSLHKAKMTKDRVGDKPLVIRADKVSPDGIDLYLNDKDAKKVLAAEKNFRLLSDCRVMIVVNTFPEE